MSKQLYTVGKIVENAWGYDQTNIDYYLIVKRTAKFVTLQPIGKKNIKETGFMSGKCEPDPSKVLNKPAIRRKVHTWEGEERGIAIYEYGWCDLWQGNPSNWSNYH